MAETKGRGTRKPASGNRTRRAADDAAPPGPGQDADSSAGAGVPAGDAAAAQGTEATMPQGTPAAGAAANAQATAAGGAGGGLGSRANPFGPPGVGRRSAEDRSGPRGAGGGKGGQAKGSGARTGGAGKGGAGKGSGQSGGLTGLERLARPATLQEAEPGRVTTRKEFIERLSASAGMTTVQARGALQAVLSELGRAIEAGETLALPPLGKLRSIPKGTQNGASVFQLRLRRKDPVATLDGSGAGGGGKGAKSGKPGQAARPAAARAEWDDDD